MNSEDVLYKGDITVYVSEVSSPLKSNKSSSNDVTILNTRTAAVRQVQVLSEGQHDLLDAAAPLDGKNSSRLSLNSTNPVVLWSNTENSSSKEKLNVNVVDLENNPKSPDLVSGKDGVCAVQRDESWYTLGYAIERMSFNTRVVTDGNGSLGRNHTPCDVYSSSEEDLQEGNLTQGEDCYDHINMEEEEGMFLDHSFSQTLSLGGSPWTNNNPRNKNEDDDENFQVNQKITALYSLENFNNSSLEFLEISEIKESGAQKKVLSQRNSSPSLDSSTSKPHQSKISSLEEPTFSSAGTGSGPDLTVANNIFCYQNIRN